MFALASVESITIDFCNSSEIFDRLFGPGGESFIPGRSEEVCKNLTEFIEELDSSTSEEDDILKKQCLIARAIITFAGIHGGEPYMLFQAGNTLEFQFTFELAKSTLLFRKNIKTYLQETTGFTL